jgi:hypothetical protein
MILKWEQRSVNRQSLAGWPYLTPIKDNENGEWREDGMLVNIRKSDKLFRIEISGAQIALKAMALKVLVQLPDNYPQRSSLQLLFTWGLKVLGVRAALVVMKTGLVGQHLTINYFPGKGKM